MAVILFNARIYRLFYLMPTRLQQVHTCRTLFNAHQVILSNAHHTPREGQQEADFVYSQEARNHIPLMVIDFYESKLTWHDAAAQDGRHGYITCIVYSVQGCIHFTCTCMSMVLGRNCK